MPPEVVRSAEAPTRVTCDVLLVGAVAADDGISLVGRAGEVDDALEGYLTEYLGSIGWRAKPGDVEVVATARRMSCKAVAVVGLGRSERVDGAELRKGAGGAARRLAERRVVASLLHEALDGDAGVTAVVEGMLLGLYRFTPYRSDGKGAKTETILLLGDAGDDAIERSKVIAEAVTLARDLTNEPASTLGPDALARRAQEVADVGGLTCTVWDERTLEEERVGGLLAVGRGSARPPRLIQLHHAPEGATTKVVLVGKGITFDSGGLSIKDAKSMETMKTDMAGAAAIIATMGALVRLGVGAQVSALVPSCDNMIGGGALKPGDVIKHRGGRTTEVNNTDAEGRLVLSDALTLASEQHPDAIVDAATLTGGVMVALGRRSTGLFSNDDGLADALQRAAGAAGERMWRLPLYDDLRSELESEVADLKNSGGRYGSAIIAAVFLKDFVGEGIPWAHLDIAGTARSESDSGELSKGGTGVGVRTLIEWLESRDR
ncbi:MAG: leucyl aminopeptidase [Actinomycetota bacterium]